ncbi:MAG: tetratricopeptide repeat protein [Deltaproteobacteria bacterium]|nr:tetratricopeptide repeat protein [Deltaproteobacteria bacterium]
MVAIPEKHPVIVAKGKDRVHQLAQRLGGGESSQARAIHIGKVSNPSGKSSANHANVAAALNNLALLYQSQDLHAKAEPLYREALVIFEKTLGPFHASVATSLNDLADVYEKQQR